MKILVAIFLMTTVACVSRAQDSSALKRWQMGSWEADIGYSAVVQDGATLYVSGVACSGASMQEAVKKCYVDIQAILNRYQLTSEHIIKENIFTVDIEALKKAIPERKQFYKNGRHPAATWVQVQRLYEADHLLEIELIVQSKPGVM